MIDDPLKQTPACELDRDNSAMTQHISHLATEVAKLKAIAAHTAGFLDGIAARIERWRRWDNGEGDVGSFIKAAEDCRKMAAALKRNMLD